MCTATRFFGGKALPSLALLERCTSHGASFLHPMKTIHVRWIGLIACIVFM